MCVFVYDVYVLYIYMYIYMYTHLAEDVNWYCFIWSRLSVGLKFVNSPARLKPLQQLKVPITKYCIYVLATQAGFSI